MSQNDEIRFNKRDMLKGFLGAGVALVTKPSLAFHARSKGRIQSDNFRVCFGSCNLHFRPQDHWQEIMKKGPDQWFFLGDNIYGDTRDIETLKKKYRTLDNNPYFAKFKKTVPYEAIWDDHDFGEDGADRTYPLKKESQKAFLDFFNIPKSDSRHHQEGIYNSKTYSDGRIKVYFLDCRYFRDPKKGKDYTLLGEAQWQWLEEEFAQSRAQVNLIVSPIGVLLNRLFVTEDWAEYPNEKDRLLELVAKYDLSGTFFLSGDKHFGAAIKRKWNRNGKRVRYYEFQSSGLTHSPSKSLRKLIKVFYGRKNVLVEKNFATIDFDFTEKYAQMFWEVKSLESSKTLRRSFYLNSIGHWVMRDE